MPRVFLLTRRRYDPEENDDGREELSPEESARIPDAGNHQFSENSWECPDELYNLTKLAEVAVATGQILEQRKLGSPPGDENNFTYTHKLFDKSSRIPRRHVAKTDGEDQDANAFFNFKSDPIIYQHNAIKENQAHVSSTENNEHECSECGKRYSTSSNLARHRQTHRSPADKKARRCPHCDKLYVSMPAFSMHVRTHSQGCKCQYCGKCFSRPWLLQGHIRTHTGEKPFKCTICGKAFADKSNLRAHVQTHSNTKPHVCGRCGKAFALKSYLYKHEESSCMRGTSRGNPDEKKSSNASPTPVIVSVESVMKGSGHLENTVRSPLLYRSTVISPNPERILYSTIEHPSVILNAAARLNRSINNAISRAVDAVQDQPVDFSSKDRERGGERGYLGLAIAV